MTAKIRNLATQFTATHDTRYPNLLVSGCSYVYNNSETHLCTWPYYLRDIAGFNQVLDCSQSGAGSNHIFNSVVNEIETNPGISPKNTLIIVMWSGLTRTDVIATKDITKTWHHMSNYHFDDKFATLSLFNNASGRDPLSKLCEDYKRLVDVDAQVYESMLKILCLDNYLKHKGFEYVFTSWKNPQPELQVIDSPLSEKIVELLGEIFYLDQLAMDTKRKDHTKHPTPDAHLDWTRTYLIPYLTQKQLIYPKST